MAERFPASSFPATPGFGSTASINSGDGGAGGGSGGNLSNINVNAGEFDTVEVVAGNGTTNAIGTAAGSGGSVNGLNVNGTVAKLTLTGGTGADAATAGNASGGSGGSLTNLTFGGTITTLEATAGVRRSGRFRSHNGNRRGGRIGRFDPDGHRQLEHTEFRVACRWKWWNRIRSRKRRHRRLRGQCFGLQPLQQYRPRRFDIHHRRHWRRWLFASRPICERR